jgi:hypothetical protein
MAGGTGGAAVKTPDHAVVRAAGLVSVAFVRNAPEGFTASIYFLL